MIKSWAYKLLPDKGDILATRTCQLRPTSAEIREIPPPIISGCGRQGGLIRQEIKNGNKTVLGLYLWEPPCDGGIVRVE